MSRLSVLAGLAFLPPLFLPHEAQAGRGIGWTSGDIRGSDGDVIPSLVQAWSKGGGLREVIDLLWGWRAS